MLHKRVSKQFIYIKMTIKVCHFYLKSSHFFMYNEKWLKHPISKALRSFVVALAAESWCIVYTVNESFESFVVTGETLGRTTIGQALY